MSTITLPNIRVGSDLTVTVRLKDGGVAIDWSTLSNIKAYIYSDAQRALAGRCAFSIDEEDNTLLVCTYAANKPQYLGVNRIVISAKYMGETKTYDKPAFSFVRWTDDQAGEQITIEDPDIDVEISVEDVSSSILQEAVDAAFTAADRANEAAAAAEHMVDIHTGPEGKSAYEVAVEEGYTGTEEEWLASLVGPQGAQGIQGETGEAAGFGSVSAALQEDGGDPSVVVAASGEDTSKNFAFTFKNLKGDKGDKGDQGNTGSSVDYPYELVNNCTTDDATKGLAASQGVALQAEVSQLEAKVDGIDCVSVDSYGATPDGATDCTDAIMSALENARTSGKRLVFGNGTYLTRKGLVLTSGMRVSGSGKTVIKNASAVLDDYDGNAGNGYCSVQRTTEAASAGATSIKLYSASGLAVGQEITIVDSSIPSYQETSADITSISGGGVTEYTPVFESGQYLSSTGQPTAAPKMIRTQQIDFSGTLYFINHTIGNTPSGVNVNLNVQIYTWKSDGTFIERIVKATTLDAEVNVVLGANVGKIAFVLNCGASDHDLTAGDISALQGKITYSHETTSGGNAYTIGIDTSRFTADGQNGGLLFPVDANGYVTTDFSIIKTVDTKAAVDIKIERMKLQPCGNTAEPYIYLISPINQTHQTGQPQGKFVVEDVEIDGSAHDGISAQGSGDVYINRCYVHNTRFKGIHFGTSCDKVTISECLIKDCGNSDSASAGGANGGGGAIYFCVNNHRVIIKGNNIDNCKRGVFGFDWRGAGESDTDSIVAENTFTACSLFGIYLLGGMRMVVANNVFRSFTSTAIPIRITKDTYKSRGCIVSGNIIGGFGASTADAAIYVDGAVALVIVGNNICAIAPNSNTDTVPTTVGHCCDIVIEDSSKVIVANNITDGVIDISDAGNTGIVKDNNIEAS